MRLFSFDDNEAGVIAIGAFPVGILAIGGMPVGIVAIGIGSAGVVSVSCGVAGGVLAISCGATAGVYATGVGIALGLRSSCVGLALSVLPDEPFPRRVEDERLRAYRKILDSTIPIEEIGADKIIGGDVAIVPKRRGLAWVLEHDGVVIEVDSAVQAKLDGWVGHRLPAVAHFKAEVERTASREGYRGLPTENVRLRCDRIELPPSASESGDGIVTRLYGWLSFWFLPKLVLWLVAVGVVVVLVAGRLEELGLTRQAQASWRGVLVHKEGVAFPDDTTCTVHTWLRGDGLERAKLESLELTCGRLVLYPKSASPRCSVSRSPSKPSTYRIECKDGGADPGKNSSGRPSLELDTEKGTLTVEQNLPSPFNVEIALDRRSEEHAGEELLTPVTRASASPASPSSGP